MKQILVSFSLAMLAVTLLLILATTAAGETAGAYSETDAPGDFTHFVLAEEMTTTWCGFCPTAAEQLADIYYNDGYEFYFVALISDVNDKAKEREDDYPTFYGYPTVYFDGGDEEVVGAEDDKSTYEEAIETCGARDDTKIILEMNVSFEGDSTVDVQVRVQWDEDAGILNPTFNGYLRVYITEIESRYLNADGNPYHFGFLDYAFDQEIELMPYQWWEAETSWNGAEHNDADGNYFGDLDFANLALIASVFNDEDAEDEYALQTVAVVAPEIDISGPEGEVQLTADNETLLTCLDLVVETEPRYTSGEPVEVTSVEFALNDDEYTTLEQDEDGNYTVQMKKSQVLDKNNSIMIRVTDDKGLVVEKEFEVLFGALPEDEEDSTGLSLSLVGATIMVTAALAGVAGRKD